MHMEKYIQSRSESVVTQNNWTSRPHTSATMRYSLALLTALLFSSKWPWLSIDDGGMEILGYDLGHSSGSVPPSVLPPAPFNGTKNCVGAVYFQDTTIRQTFQITLGASNIRLRISNEFSAYPLSLSAVSVALPQANSTGSTLGQPTIQAETTQPVTFSGNSSSVIPPSAKLVSDPINIRLGAHDLVTVSIYLADGQHGSNVTAHFDADTTTWFTQGGYDINRPCRSQFGCSSKVSKDGSTLALGH